MKLVPKTKKVTPSPKMKFQQLVMHAWLFSMVAYNKLSVWQLLKRKHQIVQNNRCVK